MNRVDIVAFKMCSFDSDSFIEDIIRCSSNSIILIFDFDKITVQHKPSNINFKRSTIKFCRTKSSKLNYYISPLLILVDLLVFIKLFSLICYKFRPKVCWIEDCYVGVIVGILRKYNLCNRSIYVPGDWLAGSSNKRFLSYIANNLFFPILDYLACKLNDVVLNHTEQIAKARYKFWGRKIAKEEKPYLYKMRIRSSSVDIDKKNKNICFIGNIREDSGLEIVIESLSKLREDQDVILKVIGPKSHRSDYLMQLSKQHNVDRWVEILGFVETNRFNEILSDCFCGINLLTSMRSYSFYGMPGKIVHYLQYLLPVIVTEGSGYLTSVIRDNALGIVIEPSQNAFVDAIGEIYRNQAQYRKNIIEYIKKMPRTNIGEFLEI